MLGFTLHALFRSSSVLQPPSLPPIQYNEVDEDHAAVVDADYEAPLIGVGEGRGGEGQQHCRTLTQAAVGLLLNV